MEPLSQKFKQFYIGKHDAKKFSILIPPRNKTKNEKHFVIQRVRDILVKSSTKPFLLKTDCADCSNDCKNPL